MSSLPPTQCGVAEYTGKLAAAIAAVAPWLRAKFVDVNPSASAFNGDRERMVINADEPSQFDAAADRLNTSDDLVILLQHEFKLYGGADGENIIRFIDKVRAPIVSTLHTVRPDYPVRRLSVIRELTRRSNALIVFSNIAANILRERHGVADHKIRVIPHGVPQASLVDREWRPPPGDAHRLIFLTAGLIRPTKGIEAFIIALSRIKERIGPFTYVVCGTNHPRNAEAARYRERLQELVRATGLQSDVVFIDRYLTDEELQQRIRECDVGVLTYTAVEQSSSGILAHFLAGARPVIATNFQAARTLISRRNGMIIPMGDSASLEAATVELAQDPALRREMMENNRRLTRNWGWPAVARLHIELFRRL